MNLMLLELKNASLSSFFKFRAGLSEAQPRSLKQETTK